MRGRDLQTDAGQEPQICVTLPILRGLDGARRMGKSLNNYIGVGEPAQVQFDKTMSIPDDLMADWFTLLTDRSAEEVARLTDPQQTHPQEAKFLLAQDIVRFYHGDAAAETAKAEWIDVFRKKKPPTNIREAEVPASEVTDGRIGIGKLLLLTGLAKGSNEARRAVEGGGVTVGEDRQRITDPKASVPLEDGLIVSIGKRNVVRVRLR
jgi:tyrosyl-tRNA synthetase